MPNDYHPVTTQITDLLDAQGCWHETFTHEAVRTSEEAAQTRPGYTLQQGAKAIIVRVKKSKRDRQFVMLVYPADRAFDTRKVKAFFAARDVRFASEDEVSACTDGVQVGGIPPFGNLFGLPVYAAPELFNNEKIVFNAGDRRFSVAITSADYQRLVQPTIIDIL
jgi:prolyl-tRNA editing enzyme YbaK/EbsC (Cys-tRNA(Pro) deacylase)